MKFLIIGVAIGVIAGLVLLAAVVGFAAVVLGGHMTSLGIRLLAIPMVSIPALCGGFAAVAFRRWHPSRMVAVLQLALLYVALDWLFNTSLGIYIRTRHVPIGGEAFLGLPFLLLAGWAIGALVMVPTALIIRSASMSGAPSVNGRGHS